ncbi:hypothetical protein Pfo_001754 [Paulownia fortunei]|nr:hypothetical protein Pfo_001754 [Paulownia fortunei]
MVGKDIDWFWTILVDHSCKRQLLHELHRKVVGGMRKVLVVRGRNEIVEELGVALCEHLCRTWILLAVSVWCAVLRMLLHDADCEASTLAPTAYHTCMLNRTSDVVECIHYSLGHV